MHANKFKTNILQYSKLIYTRSVCIKLYNISTMPAMNHDHVILLSIRYTPITR